MQVCIKVQVFLHTQVLVETKPLWHISDNRLDMLRLRQRIDSKHVDLSLIGGEQPRDEPHQGGLAGAIRTDESSHDSAFDRSSYVIESVDAAASTMKAFSDG